ncbi:MAG: VOC family protein [Terriglobia bacterium]
MSQIEKHVPGTFCWVELGTTDQDAAKHFYHTLFGWTTHDILLGPNNLYSIFQVKGRATAAAYSLRREQQALGIPPHWLLYVAVDNADEAAGRAVSLGGNVLIPPGDVRDSGRMAVLEDPGGAIFGVWQARERIGMEVAGIDGTLCWADLITPNPSDARDFYTALFGWKLTKIERESSGYLLNVPNNGEYVGGIPPAGRHDPSVPPHWLVYFAVSDCNATAATAVRNEAIACSPPASLDNVGRIAVVTDPEGAVFALFEAVQHATSPFAGQV